jgi:hypothetical protein
VAWQRNLQKLTLFSQDNASEVDNVLLGTEFNADFVQTWLGVADDQRIRLDWGSQRLFLPYSGYQHAPQSSFNPATHRLNITAVGVGTGLSSEMTFDLAEDIVRTVSLASSPTAGRALAFGDSSIYDISQDTQGWSLDVLEEYATPIAVYRINDSGDVHARIDRLGARCKISTFSGSLKAFTATPLAFGANHRLPGVWLADGHRAQCRLLQRIDRLAPWSRRPVHRVSQRQRGHGSAHPRAQ